MREANGKQKSYIVPIEEITPPAPVIKPKQPPGHYHPFVGYELIEAEDVICGPGYLYENGKFTEPKAKAGDK